MGLFINFHGRYTFEKSLIFKSLLKMEADDMKFRPISIVGSVYKILA